MNKTIRTLQVILIGLLISSCSSRQIGELNPFYKYNNVESIELYIAPEPSLKFAVGVDVVFINDQNIVDLIAKLDGKQWFEAKQSIVANYSSVVDVIGWEMVPGYSANTKRLPENHENAVKVIAFMKYPGSKKSSVDITQLKTARLVVKSKELNAN